MKTTILTMKVATVAPTILLIVPSSKVHTNDPATITAIPVMIIRSSGMLLNNDLINPRGLMGSSNIYSILLLIWLLNVEIRTGGSKETFYQKHRTDYHSHNKGEFLVSIYVIPEVHTHHYPD